MDHPRSRLQWKCALLHSMRFMQATDASIISTTVYELPQLHTYLVLLKL